MMASGSKVSQILQLSYQPDFCDLHGLRTRSGPFIKVDITCVCHPVYGHCVINYK
jgi:hypothetical protein